MSSCIIFGKDEAVLEGRAVPCSFYIMKLQESPCSCAFRALRSAAASQARKCWAASTMTSSTWMGVKCAPAPTGAAIHLFFSYTLMLTSHSLLQQSLADGSDGWSGLWHVCMPFNVISSGSRLACHVLERVSLEMLRRQASRFFSGSGTIHWTDPFLSLAWVHLNVALN